ncbi:MAG: hypothetical protein ACXACP_02675 [Candidatus Hodarchaeales archaeon]|jgi:hypothetical protein
MASHNNSKQKKVKKSTDTKTVQLDDEFRQFLRNFFDELRTEVRSVKQELINFYEGIENEIQAIKIISKRNHNLINRVLDSPEVEEREVGTISTGLDLLKLPSHLRRTMQVLMTMNEGGTASQVASRTGKSRSLESDYLNQLFEKGELIKRHEGKRVIFSAKPYEDEGESEENDKYSRTMEQLSSRMKL